MLDSSLGRLIWFAELDAAQLLQIDEVFASPGGLLVLEQIVDPDEGNAQAIQLRFNPILIRGAEISDTPRPANPKASKTTLTREAFSASRAMKTSISPVYLGKPWIPTA